MSSASESTARRRVPAWVWVALAALLLVTLAIVVIFVLPRGSGDGASPSPSVSASPSDSPSATASATPTPVAVDVGGGTFDSDLPATLADVLDSQNTAVLAQGGTFTDPVLVQAANSGLNQNMTPDEAVDAMAFMFTPSDPTPWDLALSESVLDGYRSGPYGDHFPAGAIVARSADGHVFSFVGHDSTITAMFMAASESLLTP